MGEEYLVSIIMGVFNIEKLRVFEDSMLSILNQDYKNFEFIICNDGSTDKTGEILHEWCQKDKRIKIITSEENRGLASALNKCIEESRGKYIARHDADDISDKLRIKKQIQFLNTNDDVDFVGCNVSLYDENGIWGRRLFKDLPEKEDFLFIMPFVHGTLIFRKESLIKCGKYRVSKFTIRAEDYDMLMKMYSMKMKGANLQEELYLYMEDVNSIKRRKYKERIYEMVIRWKGFYNMGMFPKAIPYVIKPLIVGLIPISIMHKIKIMQYKK